MTWDPAILGRRGAEAFDQQGAGAADAALHGAGRAIADGGGFLIGEAEAENQADGVGHVGGQAGDEPEEDRAVGGVFGQPLVHQHAVDRLVRCGHHPAVAAQPLQPFIAQDAEDPRPEGAGGVIAREGREGAHAGVLHAVVGHVRVTAEAAGIGAQFRKDGFDEVGKQVVPVLAVRAGVRWAGLREGLGICHIGVPAEGTRLTTACQVLTNDWSRNRSAAGDRAITCCRNNREQRPASPRRDGEKAQGFR